MSYSLLMFVQQFTCHGMKCKETLLMREWSPPEDVTPLFWWWNAKSRLWKSFTLQWKCPNWRDFKPRGFKREISIRVSSIPYRALLCWSSRDFTNGMNWSIEPPFSHDKLSSTSYNEIKQNIFKFRSDTIFSPLLRCASKLFYNTFVKSKKSNFATNFSILDFLYFIWMHFWAT